ncbi:unnamed protein product [Rhizoctonia solani]|uniref:BTB domain-containing protein n=1 Tax=Rhizoctonia solani TaxID=456999 RepID=A0A8H3BCJ4_9AGAM|nr:unnamed protein product [Rhizoctonia solani]CAE6454040.1 unnamed protein product [Rhizoctonia solani]
MSKDESPKRDDASKTDPPADSKSAYNQGFTQGGDLTISSSDRVDFNVHSVLLSLASPTFADLLKSTNLNETVRFSERAELLALVLQFIYPLPSPVISSHQLLNDALRVADKYQLTSMKARLREQLKMADSPVSAYSNPLAAVCVASSHGFTPEADIVVQVAMKQYDFGKPEDLKTLIDTDPAATALAKLVGIPAVKTKVLADVLFHFDRSPMSIASRMDALVCSYCRETYKSHARKSTLEWHIRWAHWIFQEIRERPIAEWKEYFSHSKFYRWYYQPDLATSFYAYKYGETYKSCGCSATVQAAPTAFQPWADGVYNHLKSRLAYISELETRLCDINSGAKKDS